MDPVDAARGHAFSFVEKLNEVILQPIVLLLTAVALAVFLYGGFQYILNSGNEQERSKGKKHMIFGIIGFLVMVSALAILRIFAATLGLDSALDESMNP